MKNPLVAYALIRLTVFAGALAVLLLVGFNGIYATFIATALAFVFSMFLLRKPREEAAKNIYSKVNREKLEGIVDSDTIAEDEALDKK
jgi:hypothetical protein